MWIQWNTPICWSGCFICYQRQKYISEIRTALFRSMYSLYIFIFSNFLFVLYIQQTSTAFITCEDSLADIKAVQCHPHALKIYIANAMGYPKEFHKLDGKSKRTEWGKRRCNFLRCWFSIALLLFIILFFGQFTLLIYQHPRH